MIYYDGNFWDYTNDVFGIVTITDKKSPFVYFSNGAKHIEAEIKMKVKNYTETKSTQIINKIEVERLINKNKTGVKNDHISRC
jgi:hypothetical protein